MAIAELAAALRSGQVTAISLTEQAIAKAEQENPRLNAFITITAEHALAQARQADQELAQGRDRGPLHGIPYAAKDCFATRGIRTTCGSLLFAEHVPDADATAIAKLTQAGAVLIGKTNMHELAYGVTSQNPYFGGVRNPLDVSRIPGGSSGGSAAAVGAGIVPFALGTDTGGSIRIPAAFCGCVGLKPTTGRVSRSGILPLDYTLDHAGPICRTSQDAALVLQALAGWDEQDPSSSTQPVPAYPVAPGSLGGVRIAVPERYFLEEAEPEAVGFVQQTARHAEQQGAQRVEVTLPDLEEVNAVARVILLSEASALLGHLLNRPGLLGDDIATLVEQGCLLAATDYINAQRLRRLLQKDLARVFKACDYLLTPATPMAAPKIGQPTVLLAGQPVDTRLAATRFVRGWNVMGVPALSVPCGVSANPEAALPYGVQIVGRWWDESGVLQMGHALQQ